MRPTNPPQHIFDQGTGIAEGHDATQGPVNEHHNPARDNADPHPPDEGNPYEAPHPGGTKGAPAGTEKGRRNIGPNPAVHDGTPGPAPDNADRGPPFAGS